MYNELCIKVNGSEQLAFVINGIKADRNWNIPYGMHNISKFPVAIVLHHKNNTIKVHNTLPDNYLDYHRYKEYVEQNLPEMVVKINNIADYEKLLGNLYKRGYSWWHQEPRWQNMYEKDTVIYVNKDRTLLYGSMRYALDEIDKGRKVSVITINEYMRLYSIKENLNAELIKAIQSCLG